MYDLLNIAIFLIATNFYHQVINNLGANIHKKQD